MFISICSSPIQSSPRSFSSDRCQLLGCRIVVSRLGTSINEWSTGCYGLEIVCEIVMYRYVPMSHMISVYRCYIIW